MGGRPMAANEMEQPGWFDNELVVQFLAKLKNQLVSWVVFLFGLYFVLPRVINSVRTSYQRTRAGLETFRKISEGFDLLAVLFERLDPEKLERLLKLEQEIGNASVVEKVQNLELLMLQEANTRLTSMSVSGRPFWEADAKGSFTFVSIGFARMLSASPADCMGKGWLAFVQDADRARVIENWFEAVTQERQFHCLWTFNSNTGGVIAVVGNASPVYDANRKVCKFVGIVNPFQEATVEKLPD
jgi:PAS domain-containing protein